MFEKTSDWITYVVTGDEKITQWVILFFIIVCFLSTIMIVNFMTHRETSVQIGEPENQLSLSEI